MWYVFLADRYEDTFYVYFVWCLWWVVNRVNSYVVRKKTVKRKKRCIKKYDGSESDAFIS